MSRGDALNPDPFAALPGTIPSTPPERAVGYGQRGGQAATRSTPRTQGVGGISESWAEEYPRRRADSPNRCVRHGPAGTIYLVQWSRPSGRTPLRVVQWHGRCKRCTIQTHRPVPAERSRHVAVTDHERAEDLLSAPNVLNKLPLRPFNRDGERARPPGPEQARRQQGQQGTSPNGNDKNRRSALRLSWPWVLLLIFLIVNWLVAPVFAPDTTTANRITVPYTTFKEQVSAGNVSEITTQGDAIQGDFRNPVTWPPTGEGQKTSTTFATRLPSFADPSLETLLEQKGVIINARPPDEGRGWLLTLLLSFGPGLLFFGLLMWMFTRAQRTQSGVFGIGKSKAKRYAAPEGGPRITFADVAGIEEAEAELIEIVDFLKNPEKYQRLGGSIPKGVLLVGPPGTGKTLLAKAVAGEAGVPFFSMSGSEFIEMIVGVGASRVRDLFNQAKAEAPAIIFVDELDAIGRRRGGQANLGGHEEREQTLNQLLVEMDGFDSRQAVIVLAATNRPDVLDPALLRPGRFDRRVVVQRPDRVGREKILEVHVRGVPLATDVDLGEIAASTPGLVGADLRNLVNEAALLAARRERDMVTRADFFDAMEKIVLGPERSLVMNPDDRRRVAYHEAGHALVGLLLPEADPVQRVTIVPRGQALGVTYSRPLDDIVNYTEPYLRARIAVALGGRIAEELIFNMTSTGAENDIKQATNLARQMVIRWGMSPKIGLLSLVSEDGNEFLGGALGFGREHSESVAGLVDQETRRIIDECYAQARALLEHDRQRLVGLAEALLAHESLDKDQVLQVTGLPPKEHSGRLDPAAVVAGGSEPVHASVQVDGRNEEDGRGETALGDSAGTPPGGAMLALPSAASPADLPGTAGEGWGESSSPT
ncbi:MAG: ATP-dependent zinc metalloprotease FtsH [Chloroflexi bacterium]|nr:ATP-dependent zinc metalloprotease FtsH [Chloroflexota bacterium]